MQFYHSNLLSNRVNIIHLFTTIASGNLAFHVGDIEKNVLSNHNLLAKQLNYDKSRLIYMKQIHSNLVYKVGKNDDFSNPPTCDALITNKTNIPLMVMVGDCSPILFYDPVKKVIAVAHAGRAGAFNNIVKNVIESFTKEYESNPKNIVVCIGASIKPCCYEVREEIYKLSCELKLNYAVQKTDNRYYLDISSILNSQLIDAGIRKEHIEISTECTCCTKNRYFSYRADKKSGRFAGVLILK